LPGLLDIAGARRGEILNFRPSGGMLPFPPEQPRNTIRPLKIPCSVSSWSHGAESRARLVAHPRLCFGHRWWRDNEVVMEKARAQLPADLGPGETARVELETIPPKTPGTYTLRIEPVSRRQSPGLPTLADVRRKPR